MKYLIDTNIILDVLLNRKPYYTNSAKVLNLSGKKNIALYVTASAVTDIYYIANQTLRNKGETKELLVFGGFDSGNGWDSNTKSKRL